MLLLHDSCIYNDNEQKLTEDNMTKEEITSIIDHRIIYHIEDFYDSHSNYDYRTKIQYRIQEDLFLAEDLEALSYDDWHICMCIVWGMGTGYDMEERLS